MQREVLGVGAEPGEGRRGVCALGRLLAGVQEGGPRTQHC